MIRLETPRLILRDHEREDLEAFCAMESDAVYRWSQGIARLSTRSIVVAATLASGLSCGRDAEMRTEAAAPTCGWTDSSHLGPQGIGDLRIGVPASELMRRCTIVRDTIESLEGQPQRFLYVRLGAALAYAEIVNDSVWRIGTRDSLLRTTDGLGVGTTVRTLLESAPVWATHGERGVVAGLRDLCGLSFMLAPMYTAPGRPHLVRRPADLQNFPYTPAVEILIVGSADCGGR